MKLHAEDRRVRSYLNGQVRPSLAVAVAAADDRVVAFVAESWAGRCVLGQRRGRPFFGALKNEMYHRQSFANRARARSAVAEYVEVF